MGRSVHFHSKWFRQSIPQHEIHHSKLPSYFKYFYCQWAHICIQQRHQHYFTSKPTRQCWVWGSKELQVDAQAARDHGSLKKQLFDHGQATASGKRALAWLLHPLWSYNQITVCYRRQNTPLNKEMMNIRCAIVAHFGYRLKTSNSEKPTCSFIQEGYDRVS